MNRPTRILSDVHFGHNASLVREVGQLAPLLEGAGRVIFNGDSVEMRFAQERKKAAFDSAALSQLCLSAGAEPLFVNGNHDPTLSEINHVDLANGNVLVTHGDILFPGLSPWSREAARLQNAQTRELEALGNPADLENRLRAARVAAASVERFAPRLLCTNRPPSLGCFLHELWPPWRPLRILECWAKTPSKANALATECRPEARFVVIGHTHWGGVWRVGNRVVVNTGCFLPLSRRFAVDVCLEAVTVWQIVIHREVFRLGRQVARIPLEEV